jgi:hypothetical protein
MRSLPRFLPAVAVSLALLVPARAEVSDAPPVDTANLIKELAKLREAQTVQSKTARQTALQQVNSAAASAERAVAVWEDAVRAVQFNGAPKEGAGFREWKEKEGDALSAPLARNAARLFFVWLGLTIQRDGGATVKDLMPSVIAYTRELIADQQAVDALEDSMRREKELAATNNRRPPSAQHKPSDDQVRKMHDHILRRPMTASPVVQWLKLGDFLNPDKWEKQPGDLDGIYNTILLPELRAQHDPRVLEYWDLRLRREGEAAAKTKLAFDLEKFTTQRRPTLLWSRAQDALAIGQKNRAIGEMFALIKANPQHPEVAGWIATLESLLAPMPAGSAAESATPGATSSPTTAR